MKKYLVFICLAFINFKLTPMQKVQDKKVDVFLKIKSNSKEKIDLKELNNCINEMLKNKDPRLEKQMLKVFHEKYFGSKDILIQALEEGLSNLAQKGYSTTIKDTCYSLINLY